MSSCQWCYQAVCCCPMSQRKPEPFIDPTDAIREYASQIRLTILRAVLDREKWAKYVELSIERSGPDSDGAKEYGNLSYTKTDEELEFEGACEIADLIFYLHIPLAREGAA